MEVVAHIARATNNNRSQVGAKEAKHIPGVIFAAISDIILLSTVIAYVTLIWRKEPHGWLKVLKEFAAACHHYKPSRLRSQQRCHLSKVIIMNTNVNESIEKIIHECLIIDP
jgi:hypothetical protein